MPTKSLDHFQLCVDYRDYYNIPGYVGLDSQNNYNSHNSLNSHDRSYTLKQARKGLIFPRNLFVD